MPQYGLSSKTVFNYTYKRSLINKTVFYEADIFYTRLGTASAIIPLCRYSGPINPLIATMEKGFSENKKRQTEENFDLSNAVNPVIQFSNHFIPDLNRLANLLTA
jgi:hypothetical protein